MMFEYVLVFIFSISFCFLASKARKKGMKKTAVVCGVMAIIAPALLAGLRTSKIGTDVNFYLRDDYKMALKTNSLGEYLRVGYGEPLFLSLVYLVANVFQNLNMVLFVIELVILSFVYKACRNYEDKVPVFLSYAFFLFIYYNMSLNLLRQSIAMAISLFAYKYLMNGKNVKYLCLVAIASLFHITALIMLAVGVIYLLYEKIKNEKVYYGIVTAVVVFSMLMFEVLIRLLVQAGFLAEKYLYYLSSSNIDVSVTYIGFSVFLLGVALVHRKKLFKMDRKNSFLIFLSFLNIVLLLMSFRYNNAERLTYYFGIANMMVVPQVVMTYFEKQKEKSFRKTGQKVLWAGLAYMLVLMSYHVVYYGVLGNHKTYPYESIVTIEGGS